jgi:hypothetical protein
VKTHKIIERLFARLRVNLGKLCGFYPLMLERVARGYSFSWICGQALGDEVFGFCGDLAPNWLAKRYRAFLN